MTRNEENPTSDLSKFGIRELKMAGELLLAYASDPLDCLSDGVKVMMNTNSGNVFLTDEDYNVGMMNGDKLEQWFNCSYCGHEGFKEDMNHEPESSDCEELLKDIGVKK